MTTSSIPLRKRLIFTGLLLLVGLGLGALVLEATVRLFFPTTDFLWEWDSRIGMKLVPGMQGRSVKAGAFDVPVDVNSIGFRDKEHSTTKPKDTKRVVLLGDSFVEALQVPFENSITAQLQARLNRRSVPAEVMNFGVSATGTARQYLALREYGLQYKPDAVLLFFVGNDISDNSRRLQGRSYVPYPVTSSDGKLARDENGQPAFTPFTNESSILSPVLDLFRNHWKSYRFIRESIDSLPAINRLLYSLKLTSTPPDTVNAPAGDNLGFYEIYRHQEKPEWAQAWQVTEELLLSVRDLSESVGAKFGVVIIPAAWEVYSDQWGQILARTPTMRDVPLDLERPSKRLTGFLADHNVTVINLLPDFRARSKNSPTLYIEGDAHWTSEGHHLAADLLAMPISAMLSAQQSTIHAEAGIGR